MAMLTRIAMAGLLLLLGSGCLLEFDDRLLADAGPPDSGGPACDGGLNRCAGSCVDLDADDGNCGSCGHSCPGANRCCAGSCSVHCN